MFDVYRDQDIVLTGIITESLSCVFINLILKKWS